MNELSLFTGGTGGVLGGLLLGWKTLGYVEINDYCQRIIAQRIRDGYLHDAPIYGDIRTFISDGYAASYQGMVDVVSAGFPCQPFSASGQRKGADDHRNMWPETLDVIRIARPRFAFLENVRGLVSSGYFQEILKDLAESGYDARWRVLSAAELGAPHKRDRLWIVAHRQSKRTWGLPIRQGRPQQASTDVDGCGENVADANGTGQSQSRSIGGDSPYSFSESCSDERGWWATEPDVGRMAHGVAARVDRLKAIGNGQVPLVAAIAWILLTGDINNE